MFLDVSKKSRIGDGGKGFTCDGNAPSALSDEVYFSYSYQGIG